MTFIKSLIEIETADAATSFLHEAPKDEAGVTGHKIAN